MMCGVVKKFRFVLVYSGIVRQFEGPDVAALQTLTD